MITGKYLQSVLKRMEKDQFTGNGYFKRINFICCVSHAFPTDLQCSSLCQHHSSYMSVISSYNLTSLTPAFSLPKLLPSGTAVLYLSTSFTCHLHANLSWKHSFSPSPPFLLPLFYLVLQSKAAHGQEYARCCKLHLLHKDDYCVSRQHLRVQKTSSNNIPQIMFFFLTSQNSSNQNHTCFILVIYLY